MKTECCVNQENVDIVVEKLIPEDDIVDISDIFKILGDPSRMRIVAALRIKELCVGDISALMEISLSGVSHQLRLLKKSRIIKSRREGKLIYYSLDDDHIESLIDIALDHVRDEGT
ncbi:ArsR/SmtB family transcription factor [Salinispira pacifica]|uniref:ArsR/SmtB family transcription factor n=1 Tax=Salinispira pacifica TaxID=1307761 RepID=UPI00059EBC77|nr:metalloregulator ArsR/SmtB family transcription factor [Salinispira pacifica]